MSLNGTVSTPWNHDGVTHTMNPFPHRTSPHRAVIVLIVLGLGALVFQALQRAGDLYSAAGGESTLRRGDCVYQVFIDDIPLGVVCVDQPTSITALLEILGAKGEDRLVDHSRPIACNRIVRLSKASHEVSYEDLPGKVLLLAGKKIDVNTADADDLGAVPGLGTTLATRVTRFRDSFGPFSRMEELARVPGIGKGKSPQAPSVPQGGRISPSQ